MRFESDTRVDLVITAPVPYAEEFAYAVRARSTLGVVIQLLATADRQVILAAPFLQAEPVLEVGVLAWALRAALSRGVSVGLMTTRQNLDLPLVRAFHRRYPAQFRLYHPAFPTSDLSKLGSHAKFCIQDDRAAYVGSANLTAPALGGGDAQSRVHFEMGLLVEGAVARQLAAFWEYALRFGIFENAPGR